MVYPSSGFFSKFLAFIMAVGFAASVSAQAVTKNQDKDRFRDFKTEHLWDAKVKIASAIVLGQSKYGMRQVIPITGGTFEGSRIKGVVLPGGEDWQSIRPDGDAELYARYLLKTDDGFVIQVTNRALIHTPKTGGQPYIKSVIDLEAPKDSPYDYLNHAIFIGTLDVPPVKAGEEPYVVIGVYMLL